jgi:hypothetical protein
VSAGRGRQGPSPQSRDRSSGIGGWSAWALLRHAYSVRFVRFVAP